LAESIVDEKHRVTLPKALRKSLGITSGTKLKAEQRGGEIIIRPAVPVGKPTEAIWGLASGIVQRNPKRQAREAIARRKIKEADRSRFVETNIFLHAMTAHPEFGHVAKRILGRIDSGDEAATSSSVIAEVCARLECHRRKPEVGTFFPERRRLVPEHTKSRDHIHRRTEGPGA